MSKPLNILFITSEAEPFSKTGGLADVSSALPKMIRELGHDIRIMTPRYGTISERKFKLHDVIRLREIPITVGDDTKVASVNSSFISSLKAKVQVYFLANKDMYNRAGLYTDPVTLKDYADNDTRFIFFCRGVLETLKKLGWQPDIIHCNDWQTGLIPAYMKTVFKDEPTFKNIKTVFTVHNLGYQGIFPDKSFAKTGLPDSEFTSEGIEFHGKLNFVKAGLVYSDIITTVSEKYAQEITTSEDFGFGLEGILKKRKNDLYGIINGIDYTVWNPETDPVIDQRYDIHSLEGKEQNKMALVQKFGLQYKKGVPVIGCITRLVDQKGIDLIKEIADDMMKLDIQFIMIGLGEKRYHEYFESLKKKYPKKAGITFGMNEEIAHLIEAGSDMYLMPSRYEPCGLNQLYSLKYGTVPIVRATGGLDDTIQDVTAGGNGTGFKFQKYESKELLKTIQRAVKTYGDQKTWQKIMRNGMAKDFSWESSAKKYINLYRSLLK
ncbi:MAG TPA: glycogen synthase GlgA [Bacteroidetes bacterium]|nr:glycogen synthase GlgA [Bacteroidota bacterium]